MLDLETVVFKADEEGVEYFCTAYCSPSDVENLQVREAMVKVEEAIKNFETVLQQECRAAGLDREKLRH